MKGKIVWITGASSGIGETLAYELSKAGTSLILSARRKEVLEKVRSRCENKEQVFVLPMDLSDWEGMELLCKQAMGFFGSIDILVNNAGISQRSLITETVFSVDKKLMDVNYLGTVTLSKALLPYFLSQRKGHYVTVTSLMGKFGSPYRSAYCASKHALHGFFDVLRMEHEKDGIIVTMICPGFVDTNVARNALTGNGKPQNTNDEATKNGLSPSYLARKIIKAVDRKKFEVYIGKREVIGIYLKRFFPKLLHKMVLKSKVR
ncbi:SDR family oxidoreductase [Ascidiimonas aurantiaca]|uniref:SDR family oxidoreductase n=1 Tax=Ascidiimonas aurantiaca TaxID=1685432 RepID=UPI0030EB4A06